MVAVDVIRPDVPPAPDPTARDEVVQNGRLTLLVAKRPSS